MRPILRDPELQGRFERDGYVILDGLDERAIDRFRRFFAKIRPNDIRQMYSNVHDLPVYVNEHVGKMLHEEFDELLDRYCIDYKLIGGTYLIKGAGDDSVCNVHQDWNTVDESQHTGLAMWVPLVDVDPDFGCLVVAPGSHRRELFPTIRGANFDTAHLALDEDVLRHTVDVPLKAGTLCLFAQNLFHGSRPNSRLEPRECLYAAAIPQEAQMLHYRCVEGDLFDVLDVSEDFYYSRTAGALMDGRVVAGGEQRDRVRAERPDVSKDEFVETMERVRPTRATQRRTTTG